MKIDLIRSDSLGIAGTYRNAKCHAKPCIPLIDKLVEHVHDFGFDSWKQGHNVHIFETKDGRKFDMVPYSDGTNVIGIEFRIRLSRTSAIPLAIITDVKQIPLFIKTIKCLSKELPVNHYKSAKKLNQSY